MAPTGSPAQCSPSFAIVGCAPLGPPAGGLIAPGATSNGGSVVVSGQTMPSGCRPPPFLTGGAESAPSSPAAPARPPSRIPCKVGRVRPQRPPPRENGRQSTLGCARCQRRTARNSVHASEGQISGALYRCVGGGDPCRRLRPPALDNGASVARWCQVWRRERRGVLSKAVRGGAATPPTVQGRPVQGPRGVPHR